MAAHKVTLDTVRNNWQVQQYLSKADEFLGVIGRIQHDIGHAELVALLSRSILEKLGYAERDCELAAIAGYLHDIGNLINRSNHGLSGALMAYRLLHDLGMAPEEIAVILSAIGNHEENTGGYPVNHITAAVILADKSNVHRSRVRKCDPAAFTTRDRVNYAAEKSVLEVNPEKRLLTMRLTIDNNICSVMEYFEIFLTKMVLCRRAANALKCQFELIINEAKLL